MPCLSNIGQQMRGAKDFSPLQPQNPLLRRFDAPENELNLPEIKPNLSQLRRNPQRMRLNPTQLFV